MRFPVALLPLMFAVTACGGGSGGKAAVVAEQPVSLDFTAEADGQALACNAEITGLGSTLASAYLKDFRFYIHDVELIKADNSRVTLTLDTNAWQSGGVALLDFQDKAENCDGATKETRKIVEGTAPAGNYVGVAFKIGVPASLNHANSAAAASPLNISSLFWSWQSGYKFMRLDVAPVGGLTTLSGPATTFNFHLGSTDCTGTPQNGEAVTCGRANRPAIVVNNFDPANDEILLNYAALVRNTDITNDSGGAPGCMGGVTDPECNDIFTQLGLDFVSGAPSTALEQAVFSARPAQ